MYQATCSADHSLAQHERFDESGNAFCMLCEQRESGVLRDQIDAEARRYSESRHQIRAYRFATARFHRIAEDTRESDDVREEAGKCLRQLVEMIDELVNRGI